ncbi:hypothetical protein [Deferrisoma sp.]
MKEDSPGTREQIERLMDEVARLQVKGLALGMGVLGAVCVFVATNWLVVKGGPVVGPHLRLLAQYFAGYTVTFGGSFIGAAYGFVVGAAAGATIAWIYNRVATRRARRRHR